MFLGLTYIDLIIMVIYFTVILYIGYRASKKIKSQEDFLLGGRKFGKLLSTFASFGQATSADGPAGVSTTTFNNGASGIWSSLLMLFVTPLFWITAPWLRRLRILTMGDFYVQRYGSVRMGATYALIASIGMMGLLSVGYMAVSKTAFAMTSKEKVELSVEERDELEKSMQLKSLESQDLSSLSSSDKETLNALRIQQPRTVFSHINENALIWMICFLVIFYTILGGLEAAIYTDLLQGVFIILLSFILLPFAWSTINDRYGGEGVYQAFKTLHENLPLSSFEIFGSPNTIDFTWYFILTAALVSGITVVTQPNQLVTAGAAKDEFSARVGFVTGTFMKRVITCMWGVLGLCAILLYTGEVTNSDLVWGHATRELLGGLNMGLVGLMLASMMAALMSTADCLMITVSGLVVNNLYLPFNKQASEKTLILVGRIAGAIFLIGGAIITTQFDGILQILKFVWEFFVIFAAAFWLGLKWRKANKNGAWISILGSFSLFYLIPIILPFLYPSFKTSELLLKETNPQPIERAYTVRAVDVTQRNLEIQTWRNSNSTDKAPVILTEGAIFNKSYQLPKKSIFWSKGVSVNSEGEKYGSGYIYLELLLLDNMGFDLSKNPFALNESIRMLIRLLVPFLLLIFGSLLFYYDQKKIIDKFYLKMRIPVSRQGHEVDKNNIRTAIENNEQHKDILLFPTSNWEFYRWNSQDKLGFFLSWGIVALILGLLYFIVSYGS